jgi:hypothetical protein
LPNNEFLSPVGDAYLVVSNPATAGKDGSAAFRTEHATRNTFPTAEEIEPTCANVMKYICHSFDVAPKLLEGLEIQNMTDLTGAPKEP